ncbi:hypothetical protein [Horticoccus sp. 23ND18S-11]|uniref:hypothetical protein n=1 Tax=Horticoccus sp. 23ND18S-11 TaxID=3391832 RepID=UPI0039C95D4F
MPNANTAEPLQSGVALNARPEFIRLPKNGKPCPLTGMSRSGLNNLILPCPVNGFKPPVKSVSLRQTGGLKGVRLISVASLLGFLHGCAGQSSKK